MAQIRGKDTSAEVAVRQLLYSLGYRYRLHIKTLPGCPDIVFRARRRVIFVHGCFWHGHSCRRGKRPSSNREFWDRKLTKNEQRDRRIVEELNKAGWRSLIVWECEIHDADELKAKLSKFLGRTKNA